MCTEHWRAYVKGLRQVRMAGKAADEVAAVEVATEEADAA